MEAADEKLTALKKAYADIILSISKEAAARVMASERKSLRYQHELKVAKEEGVRMLMRLKQMMDSQNSEAEAASLNQQKKIEELEAQLQEAEDIVRDLREELRELQAKLERVKSENSDHVNERVDACSEDVPMENNISSYQSSKYFRPNESSLPLDVTVPYLSQRNECHKCYNKIVCTCAAFIRGRDLSSIILKGKTPGLYRNGCTQRIRACARNRLDRDLYLAEETDKVMAENNGRELEEGRHTSRAPAFGAKILTELEKKLLADINLGTFQSFPRKRKRAVRQRKTIIALGEEQSYLFPKPNQLPEPYATRDPISVNDSAENTSKIDPRLSRKKVQPQNQRGCAKASDNERNIVENYSAKIMHEAEGGSKKVVTLRGISEFSESLCSSDSRMDVEKVDVPSHSLESNSCDPTKGLASRPVRERVIKYTFQRKRKRQALSGSEVSGSCEMEKRIGDGQNGDQMLEQPKHSLLKESSRDHSWCRSKVNGFCETDMKTGNRQTGDQKLEQPKSSLLKESRDHRRLAQVARQLISLSEKKWWH